MRTRAVIGLLTAMSLWIHTLSAADQACPMNTAVAVGDRFELTFQTLEPLYFVNWLEYTEAVNGRTVYLNGTKMYRGNPDKAARFGLRIEESPDNSSHTYQTFSLRDSELSDGGKYCALEFIQSVFHWAEVVVLGHANCSWTNQNTSITDDFLVADDVINITCRLPYQGRWAPVLGCWGERFDNFSTVDNQSTADWVMYTFTAGVQTGAPRGYINCTAEFVNPTPDEYIDGYARNVPEYNTPLWISDHIEIKYPADNISITPWKADYDVGDSLECMTSGGNSVSDYVWYANNMTGAISSGPVLTLSEEMAGWEVNITCEATDVIRDLVYTQTHVMELRVKELPTTTAQTTSGSLPPTSGETTPYTSTAQTIQYGASSTASPAPSLDNALVIIIAVSVIAGVLAISLVAVIAVYCRKTASKSDEEAETF